MYSFSINSKPCKKKHKINLVKRETFSNIEIWPNKIKLINNEIFSHIQILPNKFKDMSKFHSPMYIIKIINLKILFKNTLNLNYNN